MALRLSCALIVICSALATACEAGDASSGLGEAAMTPAAASTTRLAPSTPTPDPPSTVALTSRASEDGPTDAEAADADVLSVHASEDPDGSWTFRVTVSHPDTGWDDYADGWDVVTPDGAVLKPNPGDAFTRVLLHPHENEQPFTRSQRGIVIPEAVTTVTVRAHDSAHGFGGHEVQVDLEAGSGADFEVERQP